MTCARGSSGRVLAFSTKLAQNACAYGQVELHRCFSFGRNRLPNRQGRLVRSLRPSETAYRSVIDWAKTLRRKISTASQCPCRWCWDDSSRKHPYLYSAGPVGDHRRPRSARYNLRISLHSILIEKTRTRKTPRVSEQTPPGNVRSMLLAQRL